MTRRRLITLQEIAYVLRVNPITVYRMVKSGKIPGSKVGRQWRFERETIEKWLRQNQNIKKNKKALNSNILKDG